MQYVLPAAIPAADKNTPEPAAAERVTAPGPTGFATSPVPIVNNNNCITGRKLAEQQLLSAASQIFVSSQQRQ